MTLAVDLVRKATKQTNNDWNTFMVNESYLHLLQNVIHFMNLHMIRTVVV